MTTYQWILKDGNSKTEYTSFPFAFRTMYNTVRKGLEAGKTTSDITKSLKIIAPVKDVHGDFKVYNYTSAAKMATEQGLLSADGQLNSKEFKR